MKRVKSKPSKSRVGPNAKGPTTRAGRKVKWSARISVNEYSKRVPCFYNCGNFVTNSSLICRDCRRKNKRMTIKSDKRKAPVKTSEQKRKRNG